MSQKNEPKGYFQYLPRSQHDQVTGFFVTDFGWTEVEPGMPYPPWQHPADYSFTNKNGRRIDEYQLVYITRGRGTFWNQATGTIDIKAGTAFLLFPGVRHTYSPDPATGWDEKWIGFKGKVAQSMMRSYFTPEQPLFELGMKRDFILLFEKIQALSNAQSPGYRRIMAIAAQEMLVRLQVSTQGEQESDNEIEIACQHIEENFQSTVNFKEYAQSIGQSYSAFRRRFKQYTGVPPHQYQLGSKLRKAKQLLDNSNLRVQDIAQSCGFESPYYFSRYFKVSTGQSPTQYRMRRESGDSMTPCIAKRERERSSEHNVTSRAYL